MRYIFLFLTLSLSGCTVVPVKHQLPDMPVELTAKCETLHPVPDDETKLSELLKIVNQNYGFYHECELKKESLIEWYTKQKKIHDDVHN